MKLGILRADRQNQGEICVTAFLWVPVPAGKRIPRPGAGSAFPYALPEEIAKIQSGEVVEEIKNLIYANTKPISEIQEEVGALYEAKVVDFGSQDYPGKWLGWLLQDNGTWTRRTA